MTTLVKVGHVSACHKKPLSGLLKKIKNVWLKQWQVADEMNTLQQAEI